MAAVVVVGGGVAGVAAAARLAKLRHSVTLCEKNAVLGGRLRTAEAPDTLTLPAALRDFFRKSGRPLERELDLRPVTTPRRHVFSDGTVLDLPVTGRAEQREAIADVLGSRSADAWTRLLDACVPLWDLLRKNVLESPYTGPRSLGLAGLRRLRPGRSLRTVARALPDARARLALASTAFGPGADPGQAPASQVVLAYVERTFGRWSCGTGMGPLVDAFDRRLEERRVTVRRDAEVDRIEVSEGAVTGVRLVGGERLAAPVVVCTVPVDDLLVDPPRVLRTPPHHRSGSPIGRLERRDPLGDEPFELIHYGERPTAGTTAGTVGDQHPATGLRGGPRRLLGRPGHRGAPVPTRTPIRGLFCAGPTAQPGPGLPFELLGAALVASEISSTTADRSRRVDPAADGSEAGDRGAG